ncbi:dual specificity mitogen-activated protein kinase kinase 7-like [Clavelina lepadiformis]|uniref:dual specificity mitogen-activated protein kinase kinase 7-like n=1 Tax=Clavelina lepadiformis TaxID=159417 RepID=UPI0040416227
MSGNVASGTVSLSDLEERMKKLESNFKQQTSKPKSLGLPQQNQNTVSSTRPQMSLNFNSSNPTSAMKPISLMSGPKKKQISFALPPTFSPPVKSQESEKVNARLQEVIRQNGKLRINGAVHKADVKEFENLGQIGSGTCGQVYKMKYRPTGHIMAVKQMHRSGNREENKRILMDLDIVQKSHDCPHIVTCYGTFVTESSVWICMELMETCFDKLKKKIGSLPENIIGKLTVSVVKALDYLKEKHGVIHRDVKPSNILVNKQGDIKLCDFGISGRLVDSQAKTRAAGCAAYMAPERISPDPSHPNYDIRADVWSLGISLVELATGVFPYSDCKTDFEMLTKILEEDPPSLPLDQPFSIDFQRFVAYCCTKDYQQRPKYKELLVHEFVKRYERTNVAIPQWLNSVVGMAKTASLQRVKSSQSGESANDPFAFAGEITKAQFMKHSRARSWGGAMDISKPQNSSTSTFSIFR